MSTNIVIDARLVSGMAGGVEQVIIGLAGALSALASSDETYSFLTYADADDWLRPYIGGSCQILEGPPHSVPLRVRLMHYPALRALWHRLLTPLIGESTVRVPHSDGTVERAGASLIHFTLQNAFLSDQPTIYQPHDLQHVHLPELFTPRERLKRDILYRTYCEQAHMVVAMSQWGRCDLIEQYGLSAQKVHVVPWGCVLSAYPAPHAADLQRVRDKFALPDHFLFYPARTWPHKNHVGLLEALARLRDRDGLRIPVVFSGGREPFFAAIQKRISQLDLTSQVQFVGFVSPLDLVSLYRLCRGVIFPSRFEGWGLPVTEAFAMGVPVACSNVTSLPEVAGNAALLFDPADPDQIADAAKGLWTDETARRTLIERGTLRARAFTWDRTARLFRVHYRRVLNHALTDEDRALLSKESEAEWTLGRA